MKITVEFDSLVEFNAFIKWHSQKEKSGKTPIRDSGLSHRTIQCLMAERIEFVEDAKKMADMELFKIPGFGRKSLNELRALMVPNA